MDLSIFQRKAKYNELIPLIEKALKREDLTPEFKQELDQLIDEILEFKKYNKCAYFTPYSYQRRWFAAAKEHKQRALFASNRTGKSYGGAMEFAYHITGNYPPDWDGVKIEKTGLYWAIGLDHIATQNVVQRELLGSSDIRRSEQVGTGSIPRHCIDLDSIKLGKDGKCIGVMILHEPTGKWNELAFYSVSQGQDALMGTDCLYIWMDEENLDSDSIFKQCLTRTMVCDGWVAITATPEHGYSDLYLKFRDQPSNYFMNVTWDDCDHLSESKKQEMYANLSPWERDMRARGIPQNGTGAIFKFTDEKLISYIGWEDIKPHWNIMAGVDFGNTGEADPSTIVYCAYNPDNDVIYTIDCWHSEMDEAPDSHKPEHMAHIIKQCPYPNIPVILPASDGNSLSSGDTRTKSQVLRECGVNVYYDLYRIPFQLTGDEKITRSILGGLGYMEHWIKHDKLKLQPPSHSKGMNELWKELRGYVYRPKKSGEIEAYGKNDHCMDAWRYCSTSVKYIGFSAGACLANPINHAYEHNRELDRRWSEAYQ